MLGCDNREMLTAVRDKYGEDIDMASRLPADSNEETGKRYGNIAALFGESVFHSNGGMEDGRIINGKTCVDFKEDTPKEVEQVLDEHIVEAVNSGLSKTGEENLRKVIQKHKSVFSL